MVIEYAKKGQNLIKKIKFVIQANNIDVLKSRARFYPFPYMLMILSSCQKRIHFNYLKSSISRVKVRLNHKSLHMDHNSGHMTSFTESGPFSIPQDNWV